MSKVEYYAGFFDGEGSVGLYRNGQRTWHLRTQVTQNQTPQSNELLTELVGAYGGNLAAMRAAIYRGGAVWNWQLNGAKAVAFLGDILPFLRLKKEQAELGIAWFALSQKPARGPNGRMLGYKKDRPVDVGAGALLKALKRQSIDAVMAAQSDLVDVVATLKQVLCVKG